MKLRVLVVLEADPTHTRVLEYISRVCAGATAPDTVLVLFTALPGLPPDIEAGESALVNLRRDQFEAEATTRAEELLTQAVEQLTRAGISRSCLHKEIGEESPTAVPVILETARRYGCDTIALARHHKSMIREFFAGDPEERLLRHPTGFTVWLIE